jgi:hypothetical protein
MNTRFLYCWLTNTALSSPYNSNERSLIQYLDSGKTSASENGQLVGILTSSDRLPPSTDQDAAHFLVYRERFQGNDRAPCSRAPERSLLSYRDLDFRRGAFCQNPDKDGITITTRVEEKNSTNLGLCLVTAPEARSSVAFNLDIAAGTSRE